MNLASREQAEGMKDWALDCLKKPKTGCGGKKKTLRVVELSSFLTNLGFYSSARFRPGPVKVKEYEVWGADNLGP